MKEAIRKFFAFEWLMLWIFCFFWASAMFLPLFLTGSLDNKSERSKDLLIMFGPYAVYLLGRCLFLIWQTLFWSYLTSNFFFSSRRQKIFADELFRFVVLVPIWALVMAGPMYVSGYFKAGTAVILPVAVVCGPYAGYVLLKMLGALFGSLGWAVQVTVKK